MALQFNVQNLERESLHLEGRLAVADLDLENVDELIHLKTPLDYDLEVEKLDNGFLVRGSLRLTLSCECSRCLKPFEEKLDLSEWACMLAVDGEEKVIINNDLIDLTPYIREDILLGFPQRPLCNVDCGGLKAGKTGKSNKVKETPGSGQDDGPDTWSELNKLKF